MIRGFDRSPLVRDVETTWRLTGARARSGGRGRVDSPGISFVGARESRLVDPNGLNGIRRGAAEWRGMLL